VNYENLYTDLLHKFGFDDPSRYIVEKEAPEEAPAAPTSAIEAIAGAAGEAGGQPLQNAIAGMAATGELTDVVNEFAQGVPQEPGAEVDPMLQQEQQLALQQPI
jgi:hypothetical protein